VAGFIEDGYQTEAILEEQAGCYEEVRFSYRPALPAEHNFVMAAAAGSEESEQRTVQLLKAHLVGWNLKRKSGTLVEITEPNLRRVNYLLRVLMYNIIVGIKATEKSIDLDAQAGNSSPGSSS